MQRLTAIQSYVPKDATITAGVIKKNIGDDLFYLQQNKERFDLENPIDDLCRLMAVFIEAMHHHDCLHSTSDTSPLENCHECLQHLFEEMKLAVDNVCGTLVAFRKDKRVGKNLAWEDEAYSEDEFTQEPDYNGPYLCKQPNKRASSPSLSTHSTQSRSTSPMVVTPKKTKQSKSPSVGRKF